MLIPSTSAEEVSGTGPCYYLSPSSSEVTKAEEELFRALTDTFSSCTCLQGRTGRQTCPEAPTGQRHDVKSLPASHVDCLTLYQSIYYLQFLQKCGGLAKPSLKRCGIVTNIRTWIRQVPNASEKSFCMEYVGKWCSVYRNHQHFIGPVLCAWQF